MHCVHSQKQIHGNYSIIFFDHTGEDWYTPPIAYDASCLAIIKAFEGFPNDVISSNSGICFNFINWMC